MRLDELSDGKSPPLASDLPRFLKSPRGRLWELGEDVAKIEGKMAKATPGSAKMTGLTQKLAGVREHMARLEAKHSATLD